MLTSYGAGGSYETSYYRLTIRSFIDGESSGQVVTCSQNFSNVEKKFIDAGATAAKIATIAVGGKQGQPGKYDVIMSPTVAANIFGQVIDGTNPITIMIGMNPLNNNHLGQKIVSEQLNVKDNALIGEGLGSRLFDVEGTPSGKTPIITNGVLTSVLHNTSTAKMNNTKTTGSSIFFDFRTGSKFLALGTLNTVFKGGDYSLEEIIAENRKPTIYIASN